MDHYTDNQTSTDQNWRLERKEWRRYTPSFDTEMVNIPAAKRLDAILSKHSWSKNKYIQQLRREGGEISLPKSKDGQTRKKVIPPRRLSIRKERDETMTCSARAMIYFTSYDPHAPFLYEVKVSIEKLAEVIGQKHEYPPGYDENHNYRHGRISYDPVLGAIEDFEAANMIIVVREFDKETKTHKAVRIFLRPEFFKSLGMTMGDTRKMLSKTRKWLEKNNLRKTWAEKRKQELLRQANCNRIASLNRPSLQNLLTRLRREFTGDDTHTKEVMEAHDKVKEEMTKRQPKEEEKRPDWELKLNRELLSIPEAEQRQLKENIIKALGTDKGVEARKMLYDELKKTRH